MVGITSFADDNARSRRDDYRIVRAEDACEVLAAAEKKMASASAPSGTHTPVDPAQAFPVDALREASGRRAGNLSAYQVSTNSFDVTFITPVLTYAAQYPPDQTRAGGRRGSPGAPTAEQQSIPALLDFANWSDYVNDFPPVLLARVTPRLVEGFWTTVARGAARTQGVAIPPIKHFRSGFSRLRAWCGDTEVAPDPSVQARTARLRERHDVRRALRLRPGRAVAGVQERQGRHLFGQGSGEGRDAGG